jgi:hypothetical protein
MINKSELIKNINCLSKDEKKHIYNILIESKCSFSSNNNGVFYNLSHLSDEFQLKLLKCTELIFRHRVLINEFENKRSIKIKEYQELINTSINNTKKQADIILDKIEINCNIKWSIEKKIIDRISYPYIPVPIPKNSVYQRISDNMREIHKFNKKKQIVQNNNVSYDRIIDENENEGGVDVEVDAEIEPEFELDHDQEPEAEPEAELDQGDIDQDQGDFDQETEYFSHDDIMFLINKESDHIDIKFINYCEAIIISDNNQFSKDDICRITEFIKKYYEQEKQTIIKRLVFKKLSKYKQIIINKDPSIVFQFILSIENLI